MTPRRFELQDGWVLEERDVDLCGKVQVYAIVGQPWEVVRTPRGWRARTASHGHARRALKGPGYESAPHVVRYLAKYAYIRRDQTVT